MYVYPLSSQNPPFTKQSWMRNTCMQIPLSHTAVWFAHANMGTLYAPRIFTKQMPCISEASESNCIWEFLKVLLWLYTVCLLFWPIMTPCTRICCFLDEFLLTLRWCKVTKNTTVNLEVQSVNYLELTAIQLKEMLPINVLGTEFRNILFKVQARQPVGNLLHTPLVNSTTLTLTVLRRLPIVEDLWQKYSILLLKGNTDQ